MSYVNDQSETGDNGHLNLLRKELWKIIGDVIIDFSDSGIKFKRDHQNFYESLMEFLFCLCRKNGPSEEKPSSSSSSSSCITKGDVLQICEDFDGQCDEHLYSFLLDVITCYMHRVFTEICSNLTEDLIRITLLTLNKNILSFMTNKKINMNNESTVLGIASNDLEICNNFVKFVVLPLNEGGADCVQLLIAVAKILPADDKEQYLSSIFQVCLDRLTSGFCYPGY